MGQAKARGTREQRIAQAIERRKVEAAAEEQKRLEIIKREQELVRNSSLEERKEHFFHNRQGKGVHVTAAMLAAILGASAPIITTQPRE